MPYPHTLPQQLNGAVRPLLTTALAVLACPSPRSSLVGAPSPPYRVHLLSTPHLPLAPPPPLSNFGALASPSIPFPPALHSLPLPRSNFGGLAFPFLREKLAGKINTTIRAVEPTACPSLTKGRYGGWCCC